MGMPQLVVTAVLVEGRGKGEVARDYGLSRRWVITLVQRYLAARTSGGLEDKILAIRKDLDRHGHEAGAATIADHLYRRHGTSRWPTAPTPRSSTGVTTTPGSA